MISGMFFSILSFLYYRALLTILIDFFNYIDLYFQGESFKKCKIAKDINEIFIKNRERERNVFGTHTLHFP